MYYAPEGNHIQQWIVVLFIVTFVAGLGQSQWGFDRWKRDLNQPFQADYVHEDPKAA